MPPTRMDWQAEITMFQYLSYSRISGLTGPEKVERYQEPVISFCHPDPMTVSICGIGTNKVFCTDNAGVGRIPDTISNNN
jgi:hypothetical protein